MSYSEIITFYSESSEFDRSIYLDLLDDIINSYKTLLKSYSQIEKWAAQFRKIYWFKKEPNNLEQDIKWLISYMKKNRFNERMLHQIVHIDKEELLMIRGQRYKFTKILLDSWLIKIAEQKQENNVETFLDNFNDFEKWLKWFTKKDQNWEISISFEKVIMESGEIKIWRKRFYIQDPKNILLFIYCFLLKWLVEHYGIAGFNWILRSYMKGGLEDEDYEMIFIHFVVKDIIALKHILETGDNKKNITSFDFRKGELFINNNSLPFCFGKNATASIKILQFLCYYFEEIWITKNEKKVTEWELRLYLKQNRGRFIGISDADINLERIRTGFLRTFENNILKTYKNNNILGKDKSHLILIGKDS